MQRELAFRAADLVEGLRPGVARKVLRALVREGEDAALMRLRGALRGKDLGDLGDPDWREALFEAVDFVVSPDTDDPDATDTEELDRAAA